MEVKMNKEIRDYQESMFWGLSFRQCLFSVLAILAALGIYFVTRKYAGEHSMVSKSTPATASPMVASRLNTTMLPRNSTSDRIQ